VSRKPRADASQPRFNARPTAGLARAVMKTPAAMAAAMLAVRVAGGDR
jgi:hypothetical protein